MTIGKLSPELWENSESKVTSESSWQPGSSARRIVFLHFYVNDRAEIYHCCLVSRIFYSVMQGAPLFDTITIRKPKQISQLVSCLTKSVQRAQYVKRLLFKLRLRHPSANAELEEAQDLAAVPFLLNLCPRLRELDKVPLLANRYDNILEATRALRNLRHLTLDCDQPESVTAELLPIALEHIYDLVSSLESDGTVSLMNFTMAPLPDILLVSVYMCYSPELIEKQFTGITALHYVPRSIQNNVRRSFVACSDPILYCAAVDPFAGTTRRDLCHMGRDYRHHH